MHILVAPNAFKHALDAKEAAKAIQRGLLASKLSCTCECFPVGDGGNGTCRLIGDRLQGKIVNTPVKDPLGRPISASFGWIDHGRTAIIEMADASGLHLLEQNELDPLHANAYGTGQLIKAALEIGARKIIVGMGGSATVDGGSGILAALGVCFLDEDGEEIMDLPFGLQKLHAIDRSAMDKRLQECELTILCDVTNPLLGENGAAHIFGPQKGATPEMVETLEAILQHYAAVILSETGTAISTMASGGVAGGASAGLKGVLNAELVNGIDYFLELTQFDKSLLKSDWVITGEGSIDSQTLQGKGPYGVAKRAKRFGVSVIGLAGSIPMEIDDELSHYFDVLLAIGNEPSSLAEALATTSQNLSRVAMQLGNLLAGLRSSYPHVHADHK
ncbi:glycerate kinase family protein [Parapedobacter tibetensis]|uniref:glycerate kinase family protein n=1 Tax=Parapedobacter tibetensis TaxID=2972951 RepID=UPI00214D32C9|nr:glycerate kinase [Parapedobacter tibetensis]